MWPLFVFFVLKSNNNKKNLKVKKKLTKLHPHNYIHYLQNKHTTANSNHKI